MGKVKGRQGEVEENEGRKEGKEEKRNDKRTTFSKIPSRTWRPTTT